MNETTQTDAVSGGLLESQVAFFFFFDLSLWVAKLGEEDPLVIAHASESKKVRTGTRNSKTKQHVHSVPL